ncbi:hypothetical protein [Clostridium sp.]|uniref:DUF3955 domain-containing protein n=1 Tax=Clostridium sp. TaxID=1506 RepID=UPI00321713D7
MGKYLISLISIVVSVICIVSYNIICYRTLLDPFFLMPVAWLFFKIGIITAFAVFVISCVQKLKKYNNSIDEIN